MSLRRKSVAVSRGAGIARHGQFDFCEDGATSCAVRKLLVDFKLLIVFVHFQFAAGASFRLDRSGELCAFVLGNLAIGEHRQGR